MQARLTSIVVHPFKGAAGIAVGSADVGIAGLSTGGVADREWMAVDRNGRFVTQREFPRLALVHPAIDDGRLVLSAQGLAPLALAADASAPAREVTVWHSQVRGFDAGDEAADWLSSAIASDVRIVRFDPALPRYSSRDYAGDSGAQVRFADGYPVLVIGQASLDHLNDRLAARGSPPVGMNRFRPNLVLAGLEPHDEDALASIEIDGVVLKPVKPCTRCQVTTVDQASGRTGLEPLRTLSTYRQDDRLGGVTFGMNAIVIAGAGRRIAVGSTASCVFDF